MPVDFSSFASGARSIAGSVSQTVGTVTSTVGSLVDKGGKGLAAAADVIAATGGKTSSVVTSIWKTASVVAAMSAGNKSSITNAEFKSNGAIDWRVRLSFPPVESYLISDLLAPLIKTGGLIFPYTPTITLQHTANYQSLAPVHNNYPFLAYENSKIDAIQISGDFYCEDSVEAQYWVGAVHYLRSVTKMFYGGEGPNVGAPPPVVRISGYGDYVFNNTPVVVTNFSVELPKDVDYISTGLAQGGKYQTQGGSQQSRMLAAQEEGFSDAPGQGISYAPVRSTITVTVQPLYSREQVRNFSLDKFVKGDYVFNSGGFI